VTRIASPVSAAQGYDSIYLLAAAMKQAGSTDGPKVLAALESLKDPIEGVVTTYNKPFSKTDHEAITQNMAVIGKAQDGLVHYAYDEDKKSGGEVRTKAAAK
jgi:branched-chain amino acid transport system substrate-binding protein